MAIEKFNIHISPFVLDDLRERLGRARWPDEIHNSGWEYGANLEYIKEICTHWGHGFDWYEQEEYLNTFSHYRTEIEGFCLHCIHEKGNTPNRIPLLLIHGYPDSFVRFLKLIPLLTAADSNPQHISFDVIVPSIPGFGYSDRPDQPGMNPCRIAELFAGLMSKLGYSQFLAHGGDWGSSIAEELARQFPDRILGIHMTDVPFRHLLSMRPDEMSEAEKKFMQAGRQWQLEEGAYALLQASKPQTLAYAINDSPIGLAAWILEKFHTWTDPSISSQEGISRDELLTNLTIYWATQTAGSAFRIYYEAMRVLYGNPTMRDNTHHHFVDIPTAIAIFPHDPVPAPREFAQRSFNIRQWTEMPRGGHFAAMEQPALLAKDIVKFATTFIPYRSPQPA